MLIMMDEMLLSKCVIATHYLSPIKSYSRNYSDDDGPWQTTPIRSHYTSWCDWYAYLGTVRIPNKPGRLLTP